MTNENEKDAQLLIDACGDLEHEVKDGELCVYYENSYVSFIYPLVFNWSAKMLRWHILDRLGLRNPSLLAPRSADAYAS